MRERLPNVYGKETLRMDGISDKVKRVANFLGVIYAENGVYLLFGVKV